MIFRDIKSYIEHVQDYCRYNRGGGTLDICLNVNSNMDMYKRQEVEDLRQYIVELETELRKTRKVFEYDAYPDPPIIGIYELNEAEPTGRLVK